MRKINVNGKDYSFTSQFDDYKGDFKHHTGNDWDDNISDYIAYFHARTTEYQTQVQIAIADVKKI